MNTQRKRLHKTARDVVQGNGQPGDPTLEDAAKAYVAAEIRSTGEKGSEHAAAMVENLIGEDEP